MEPPLPSFTPTWHNASYPAIEAKDPRRSLEGKTVVITGGGSGVGRAIAIAASHAKAKHVAVIGRTRDTLEETASSLEPHTQSSVHVTSVIDVDGLRKAAAEIGTWDVLVLNAATSAPFVPANEVSVDDFWQVMEVNCKGSICTHKIFQATASSVRPLLINISSFSAVTPPASQPGWAHYCISKLATWHYCNFVQAENPEWFVCSMHPGVLVTTLLKSQGLEKSGLPLDDVDLPGNFAIWLCSLEAAFLKGKWVSANWDVQELKARAQEIQSSSVLTPTMAGLPF